ncbi:unnamed protein product [Rotaria magnacalcarata]|uniref:Uncharacterized protein n=2 Tax=Rotaria magnacalcarata TaxID=392030 RepID=A0A816H3V7_9BILA|nr:unnamed protein product [Rotaria magnacalcarata]CAF4010596.1 unnamed protein product [Rotaria magnacalcarata]
MKEYQGTFIIGDFGSERYSAASVWQPSSAMLCDDRPASHTNKESQHLLSSLSRVAAKKGIPFILCFAEQSSPFNQLCHTRALARATEIRMHRAFSQRMANFKDPSSSSPIWFDPRGFSSLLYFSSLSITALTRKFQPMLLKNFRFYRRLKVLLVSTRCGHENITVAGS